MRPPWFLDSDRFPVLLDGQKRNLFIAGTDEITSADLVSKGYTLVDVRTLPRDVPAQHADAIEAWLQGMAEGTIEPSPERRRTIELEAKVHGLLINRSIRLDAKAKLDGENLEKILDSLSSHAETLMNVSPERIERAKQSALIPGISLKEEEVQ